MNPNTRIALNTSVIYCRLIVTIFVSLFSTRYILLALGETDFGIYNLIAGVVALFSFIASTMAGTTQRYISYHMGSGDMQQVGNVFYASCFIHICIAVIVALLVEVGGTYLVNHVLSIPDGRVADARFVLHCVTIGLAGTIVTVPYEAALMAHENILFISIVNLLNAVVKLAGAVVLLYIHLDRLRVYAVIMALLPFLCFGLEALFCNIKYKETRIRLHRISDFSLIKSMCGFAGWVLIGVTCGTIRTQGTAILLNVFFGVVANAANGIAMQVNGQLQQFSTSITTSIRPQLMKSAGCNDRERMLTLTYAACKYPFLLMVLFAVPLIIAMPEVLQLWLKEVPEYTVILCRILLLASLLNQISIGMTIAIEATGRVKLLHSIIGILHIVSLPAGYLFFKFGYPPQTIMWCIAVEETVAAVLRLALAKRMIGIDINLFLKNVALRSMAVVAILASVCCMLWHLLPSNFISLLLFCAISAVMFISSVFYIGLSGSEREKVTHMLSGIVRKFKGYFYRTESIS